MNTENTQKGSIQTVNGLISPDNIGLTLSHEHCLVDNTAVFVEPETQDGKKAAYEKLSFENVGYFRYHLLNNKDNLLLDQEDLSIFELGKFRKAGGNTIADATIDDLGRDPVALKRISDATGLNIIMGSGYYVESEKNRDRILQMSEAEIAEEIELDILQGVRRTGIRSGFIGEIGCSWPLTGLEKKVLKGAAMAQKSTGAGLQIHPGRNEAAPFEIIDILRRAGAEISHTAICHIERTITNSKTLEQLAKTGCYMEYDLIGIEGYYPEDFAVIDLPNDAQKIQQIKYLADLGYENKLLASYDICYKCRYASYGGHGYSHILTNFIPSMRKRGIAQSIIDRITIENPKTFFTFS